MKKIDQQVDYAANLDVLLYYQRSVDGGGGRSNGWRVYWVMTISQTAFTAGRLAVGMAIAAEPDVYLTSPTEHDKRDSSKHYTYSILSSF